MVQEGETKPTENKDTKPGTRARLTPSPAPLQAVQEEDATDAPLRLHEQHEWIRRQPDEQIRGSETLRKGEFSALTLFCRRRRPVG